jgi:chromosome partitioning protein
MSRVFLSYSRTDQDRAAQIEKTLSNHDIKVWQDINGIRGGDPFWDKISKAIVECDCFILLLSTVSQHSNPVRREFELAQRASKKILPILVNIDISDLDEYWAPLYRIQFDRYEKCLANRDQFAKTVQLRLEQAAEVALMFNMKGGVGKTTFAAQLGARFCAHHNKDVLLVDLDPQQNLSATCMAEVDLLDCQKRNRSIIGLFEPSRIDSNNELYGRFGIDPNPASNVNHDKIAFPLGETLSKSKLSIIPSQFEAIKYSETNINEAQIIHARFMEAIRKLKQQYSLILIDCNPSASRLIRASLSVARHLIVPILPDANAWSGLLFIDRALRDFYRAEPMPQLIPFFNAVPTEQPQYISIPMAQILRGDATIFPEAENFADKFINLTIPVSNQLKSRLIPWPASAGSSTLDRLLTAVPRDPAGSRLDELAKKISERIYGQADAEPSSDSHSAAA